jgi:hydrogenase expression/formation protein HypE
MGRDQEFTRACPLPHRADTVVQMAHGGGGRMMQRLLDEVIRPALDNPILKQRHDSALLILPASAAPRRLAFTTDSFVVQPLFFPGGDIGTLCVNGTVNDLAMSGSRPCWISVGFILEEGLPIETLRRVVQSIRRAADEANVQIVTGDTKVVDRGKGDGIFINTAGIGVVEHDLAPGPRQVQPGDAVLVSGDIGRHGIAVMAAREGIQFESSLESDCAPLAHVVLNLIQAGIDVHCLRDLTRGGLASALVEIAEDSGRAISVWEDAAPIHEMVRAACELLGFDPFYVANEGRFIAFVPEDQAERALALLRADRLGALAQQIGVVAAGPAGRVTLRSRIGVNRIMDMLSGEQLPRIC